MKIYKKIFSEFRFPGQIDIFDGRSNIVKLFYPEKFQHWTIESNSIIRLHDTKPYQKSIESLLIEHKRFIYSFENPSTDNMFFEKMMSYHKKLRKLVPINYYNRIGIRSFIKVGYLKIEEFIKNSKNNMIFSSSFIECINKDFSYNDLYLILQNENNRLNLGPMKKDEENAYTKEFVVNDNMEDDYILIDLDCFNSNIEFKELEKEYKRIYDRMYKISNNIIKFFGVEDNE